MTSQSKENYSIITLEYEYGIDIDKATNDVRDKLDMMNSQLPDGCNLPFLFKFSMEDIPILMLSVKSAESTNALYKILDERVSQPISRIKGVGTVSSPALQSVKSPSTATPTSSTNITSPSPASPRKSPPRTATCR